MSQPPVVSARVINGVELRLPDEKKYQRKKQINVVIIFP
jgi:hypothetical protein